MDIWDARYIGPIETGQVKLKHNKLYSYHFRDKAHKTLRLLSAPWILRQKVFPAGIKTTWKCTPPSYSITSDKYKNDSAMFPAMIRICIYLQRPQLVPLFLRRRAFFRPALTLSVALRCDVIDHQSKWKRHQLSLARALPRRRRAQAAIKPQNFVQPHSSVDV